MLQNPLFIQIITAVGALVVFTIAMYLVKRSEKENHGDEVIISIALFLIATILTCCLFRNILTTTAVTFGKMVIACIKIIIFLIIEIEIFFYFTGEYKELGLQIGFIIFITMFSVFLVSTFGLFNKNSNKKDVENQIGQIESISLYQVAEEEGTI